MSKSDQLQEAHNNGQKDASTSESTLLGETNYRPPGHDMLVNTGATARREAYISSFNDTKDKKK